MHRDAFARWALHMRGALDREHCKGMCSRGCVTHARGTAHLHGTRHAAGLHRCIGRVRNVEIDCDGWHTGPRRAGSRRGPRDTQEEEPWHTL